MRDLSDKTALVTGAASGIGRATALELAAAGCRLVVCDIDEAGLAATVDAIEATSECLLAEHVDVGDRAALEGFAEVVHGRVPAVDILVNNAGVGLAGCLLDTPAEDWEWIVRINLLGVVHGCRLFVPPMVTRGRGGHVVNLSSMLGYWGVPDTIAYVTTKFGVLGFSESLRAELRPHGVGVTTVCPGIVHTNIIQKTRFAGADDPEGLRSRVESVYARRRYGPERVAKAIVRAIGRNSAVVPVTPEAHLIYRIKRFAPWLATRLGKVMRDRIAGVG